MTTSSNVDVIRLWQLPDDFFSLDLDAQWRAIKAVTSPAQRLNAPRRPCPLSLRHEVLALAFFVATLVLPFARDRAAHATALLGALPFVADDNDRADWYAQFLLLRFCSITRGRWLPRVMPARMIQEYIARVDGQHDRHIARALK